MSPDRPVIKKCFTWALIAMSASFAALCGYIAWFGLNDVTPQSDIVVVLGNEVYRDGTLSLRLQARMQKGIELMKGGRAKVLFVSGARGESGVEESDAMKRFALSQNVPEERIITDPLGINTAATAKNALQYLEGRKWKSAILVSQFFHLARTDLAFRKLGITALGHAHPDYYEWRDLYSLAREGVAYIVYALKN